MPQVLRERKREKTPGWRCEAANAGSFQVHLMEELRIILKESILDYLHSRGTSARNLAEIRLSRAQATRRHVLVKNRYQKKVLVLRREISRTIDSDSEQLNWGLGGAERLDVDSEIRPRINIVREEANRNWVRGDSCPNAILMLNNGAKPYLTWGWLPLSTHSALKKSYRISTQASRVIFVDCNKR
jgi:hypothetical protein